MPKKRFFFYFIKESEIMNSKNIFWNFSTSNFVKSGFTKFFWILNHCVIGFLTSDIIKRLNLSSSSTNFSFISSVKRLSTTSMALGKKAGNPLFGLDLTRHLQRLEAIFPAIFVSKILPRMKFWTYMYQIHRKKIKIFKIDLTKLFEYIPFSEPHHRRLHWNGST